DSAIVDRALLQRCRNQGGEGAFTAALYGAFYALEQGAGVLRVRRAADTRIWQWPGHDQQLSFASTGRAFFGGVEFAKRDVVPAEHGRACTKCRGVRNDNQPVGATGSRQFQAEFRTDAGRFAGCHHERPVGRGKFQYRGPAGSCHYVRTSTYASSRNLRTHSSDSSASLLLRIRWMQLLSFRSSVLS